MEGISQRVFHSSVDNRDYILRKIDDSLTLNRITTTGEELIADKMYAGDTIMRRGIIRVSI